MIIGLKLTNTKYEQVSASLYGVMAILLDFRPLWQGIHEKLELQNFTMKFCL